MSLPIKLAQLLIVACVLGSLTSCVTKQTKKRDGVVVEEKYIVHRPVKKFIQNVEVE